MASLQPPLIEERDGNQILHLCNTLYKLGINAPGKLQRVFSLFKLLLTQKLKPSSSKWYWKKRRLRTLELVIVEKYIRKVAKVIK